ncbi:aminoglycoside phosphotransferase family protein [Paenibacillus pinihumi]|uniref:aminoglycoside phosphotransferase family protein n=1 Tax=Paenibacillus pinihumi TaxID=669462 RepID=UPI000A5C1BFF|nr:aminoglycoside phosphotransferase family protein [Paenibacillus pinihumi]
MKQAGCQVLLTTFDGESAAPLNARKMRRLAQILFEINRLSPEEMPGVQLPQHLLLRTLVDQVKIRQDKLIHGDYHLDNIVEDGEQFTVIDWTNGQRGDPRYDFAWSLLLQRVFVSERLASIFRAAYLGEHPMSQEELTALKRSFVSGAFCFAGKRRVSWRKSGES